MSWPGWRSTPPQLIVLDMSRRYGADFGFTSYDQAWQHGLTRLVQRLRGTGASVLVLGQVADPHATAPTCVSAHMDNAVGVRAGAIGGTQRRRHRGRVDGDGGWRRSVRGLSELFCTADRCPVIVGNTLVFRDDNHVTTEYAQVLAPVLTEFVDKALTRSG